MCWRRPPPPGAPTRTSPSPSRRPAGWSARSALPPRSSTTPGSRRPRSPPARGGWRAIGAQPQQVEWVSVPATSGGEAARVAAVQPLDHAALAQLGRRLALAGGRRRAEAGAGPGTAGRRRGPSAGELGAVSGGRRPRVAPRPDLGPAIDAVRRGGVAGVAGGVRYRVVLRPPASPAHWWPGSPSPAAASRACSSRSRSTVACCAALLAVVTARLTRPCDCSRASPGGCARAISTARVGRSAARPARAARWGSWRRRSTCSRAGSGQH